MEKLGMTKSQKSDQKIKNISSIRRSNRSNKINEMRYGKINEPKWRHVMKIDVLETSDITVCCHSS